MTSAADSPATDATFRWIFGYGSLVFRPAFPFEYRVLGRMEGWTRRFWQGSTDHRGVPGAPGRVATLVETPGGHVHGMAYAIAERDRRSILAKLDHREKGGYSRAFRPVHLHGATVQALVYWADETNPEYLGEAPLLDMAAQIAGSRGPSGANAEYVLRLDAALQSFGIADPDLAALARAVREAGLRLASGLWARDRIG